MRYRLTRWLIKLDKTADPVLHAPQRVSVALRAQIKDTPDGLQADQIIGPVTRPTEWISSLVVVHKKDTKKLRICLDTKDLSHAIQREYYPMHTIEDVSTRLYGAKVFSIFVVRS